MAGKILDYKFELAGAIVMSLAALLTAWSGYQSSQWGSVQSLQMGEANLRNSEAMERSLEFNQRYGMDGILVLNFVNAVVENKTNLVDHYLKSIRPDLSKLMRDWLATDPLNNPKAIQQPLAMPEYQELLKIRFLAAKQLEEQARDCRKKALEAGEYSDKYLVITILFSTILFLGGIESKFDDVRVRSLLISLSGLILLFAVYRLTILPMSW